MSGKVIYKGIKGIKEMADKYDNMICIHYDGEGDALSVCKIGHNKGQCVWVWKKRYCPDQTLKKDNKMKKGDQVKLIKLDWRKLDRFFIGQIGKVIVTRNLPIDDTPMALVKFKGNGSNIAVEQNQLKVIGE